MTLCGIDASTSCSGLALFDNSKYKTHTLINHKSNKNAEDRMNNMIKDIITTLQKWNPDIVWIEQPKGSFNIEVTRKISEILGAVRMWCVWKNKEYHEVMPSVWRKWLPGFDQGKKKREELKQESIQYVKDHLGLNVCDDEADAINLGTAVLNYYSSIEE